MLVRVLGPDRTAPVDRAELERLRAGSTRTVVDLGTGDGRAVHHLAGEHPDWWCVGLDALDAAMAETAARSARKPARGGRPNACFLRASAEAIPAELHGIADEVSVTLPWGHLLEGIVVPDPSVLGGIAALGGPGAEIGIVLNGEIWAGSLPSRFRELPAPTAEHVSEVVVPAFATVGVDIAEVRWLTATEAHGLTTTWARRLAHGRPHPRFLSLRGRIPGDGS
ncbi:MAG: rRNA methyltransferase [Actinomycetota bacterium]